MNATISHRNTVSVSRRSAVKQGGYRLSDLAFYGGFILFIVGLVLNTGILAGIGFAAFVLGFLFFVAESPLYDKRGRISQAWDSARFR